MSKYEQETDEKQKELDGLKADRARDLNKLQGMVRVFSTSHTGRTHRAIPRIRSCLRVG